jgi:uncharacterized protein YfbU (UPF0304 family)
MQKTLEKMTEFDADEYVLVVVAHDRTLLDVLEFYSANANSWKEKGWREAGMWRFLADFRFAIHRSSL